MQTLLEAHDAGRTLNVTPARVRQLVEEGALVAAAKTPRGTHLFRPEDVEALRRARERARSVVGTARGRKGQQLTTR